MKFMERIDDLRATVVENLDRIRGLQCRNDIGCSGCMTLRNDIARVRADIDLLLAQWWAQGCKEVDERGGEIAAWQSPADKLASAVQAFRGGRFSVVKGTVEDALYDALEEYEATKNAAPLPAFLATDGRPDEKKIARFLLDAMTGGALSSLICAVRDEIIPRWGMLSRGATSRDLGPTDQGALDNLKANLRSLGEDVDG